MAEPNEPVHDVIDHVIDHAIDHAIDGVIPSAREPMKKQGLTDEQEAMLGPFRDACIARALSCDPPDRAAVEQGIRDCYRIAKLAPPAEILWATNPVAGEIMARTRLFADNNPGKPVPEPGALSFVPHFGGLWWAGWVGSHEFYFKHCGMDPGADILARHEAYKAASSAGWWWPTKRWCIVTDTPSEIHRQQVAPPGYGSHRLHRLDGPALAYRDGWALYVIEGVLMREADVMDPSSITPERIKQESHAERRRLLTRLFGPDVPGHRTEDYDGTLAYLRAVGTRLIDADGGTGAVGSAPRALVEIDDEDWPRWLILTDGSTKRTYCIPAERGDATVADALARVNGGIPDDAIYFES